MKILLLTEGSKRYGLGHVSRMLAIYEAFERIDVNIRMFVRGDSSVKSLLKNKNYRLIDWQEKIYDLNIHADVVIIDSYTAPEEIYHYLANTYRLCVYFDDFKRINYPKGIVVNGTLFAEELNYPKKDDTIYLLGSKYLPLRKEFWDLPEKKVNEKVEKVLIMFGGDDIKNVTPKVLSFLQREMPEFEYYVIIGKAFKENNIKKIKEVVDGDKNITLVYYPSAKEIVKLMLDSDIGIIAAGLMTLYESMCVGLPVITVITMENQVDVLKRVEKIGFVNNVGWYNDFNLIDNIENEVKQLKRETIRMKKGKIGRNLIDGKGALRVVDFISKNFR